MPSPPGTIRSLGSFRLVKPTRGPERRSASVSLSRGDTESSHFFSFGRVRSADRGLGGRAHRRQPARRGGRRAHGPRSGPYRRQLFRAIWYEFLTEAWVRLVETAGVG